MHKFLCHYRIKNTDYCYKLCEACKGYYTKSKNFNSDRELIQYLTELNNKFKIKETEKFKQRFWISDKLLRKIDN